MHIGFGNIKNSALRSLQQRHHYIIAMKLHWNILLRIINRTQHHYEIGITGKLALASDLLKYYFQCVCIGNSTSEYCDIISSVPKAVSWVLCCVIFINDLPQSINFMIPFIFAIDTKCFQSI